MKKTEEPLERNKRVSEIIHVARKLFGLHGVERISMQEIADEIQLSKASLYYYFPDKVSLYRAVIEEEQEEFIDNISKSIHCINDPEKSLIEYVNARLIYFRSLLNLSRLRLEAYSDLKPVFRDTIIQFKEREKKIIMDIFDRGNKDGIFLIVNTDLTASLFLDLLKGLRVSVVDNKKTLTIEQEEFDLLLSNTSLFTKIFVNGLKIK